MTNQFYDLKFERLADETVRLEQKDYCGESVFIDAHPEQLKFIVRRLCGMDSATAATVEDLERKLSVITDRLEKLVCSNWIRTELIERNAEGELILSRLDGLLDLAIELDGARLTPETAEATTNDTSAPTRQTASLPDAGQLF